MQSLVGVLLQVADVLTKMMKTFMPAMSKLQYYMRSIDDLNLVSNVEFSEVRSLFKTDGLGSGGLCISSTTLHLYEPV